jgi:hypothetical protein
MEGTPTKEVLKYLSLPATAHINIIIDDYIISISEVLVEQVLLASLMHLPSTQELETILIKVTQTYPVNSIISAHRPGNTGSLAISSVWTSISSRSFYSSYPLSVVYVRELWLDEFDLDCIDNAARDESHRYE